MSPIVLLSDPIVMRIPAEDCGEPLTDLRMVPVLRLDPRLADPAGAFARLRKGVVDRLVTAQSLLPLGIGLLIVEGYRPLALQEEYFNAKVDRLRGEHPEHDDQWLRYEAGRYISPPQVAPHVAGAAVDLTLCTTDGQELPMGAEVNDTDTPATYTACPEISAEATQNRKLLRSALEAAGMVNYPTEWWHWSYGDRYWAHITGAKSAIYGPVQGITA